MDSTTLGSVVAGLVVGMVWAAFQPKIWALVVSIFQHPRSTSVIKVDATGHVTQVRTVNDHEHVSAWPWGARTRSARLVARSGSTRTSR
jgi:hypothetical protein